MNNKRRIIGIVAATLLALIGTVSLVGYVRSAKDKAVAEEALVEVYVVDEFVPKGAEPDTIASAVSLEQIPARLEQAGAIRELAELDDLVAATDLEPGDQLLAARLAAKELVSEEVTDKVQISALLEAERAVGGSLEKGDLVGVYLSFEPFELDKAGQEIPTADPESADGEPTSAAALAGESTTDESASDQSSTDESADGPTHTPNVSRLEFQHVLVTNVQTINAPVSPEDDSEDDTGIAQVTGTQYVVTLALSPEQSERFVFGTEFGRVWLSIEPASVDDDGTRAVTLGNVFTVVR